MCVCISQPDSCTPAQCEGQGTGRLAAGDVTPGQAMAAMHKIASTDHRPPPICCDARLGGCRRLNSVVELIALSEIHHSSMGRFVNEVFVPSEICGLMNYY